MRWWVVAVLLAALSPPALAQGVDVQAQIKLIENQPADMDRATWKEKRRDAARKLIQSRDKKAVPTLIKLAETETFDIIGEIAIEGLGNMGDPSAAPVLQKIAGDPSRDKAQRDLAKKSLGKLPAAGTTSPQTGGGQTGGGTTAGGTTGTTGTTGGTATGGTTTGEGTQTTTGGPATGTAGGAAGGALIGEQPQTGAPELPALPDDAIAAYERLVLAAGVAQFNYDTLRKQMAFDVDAGGVFQKRVERERSAWGVDLQADVVAAMLNPQGRAQARLGQAVVQGVAEARFYTGKIYGVGKAALGLQGLYLKNVDTDNPAQDFSEKRLLVDVQIALGGGFGRVIDVGGAIRVRRLARTLDAARALGKAIDEATARKLQLTWWALRGERSAYRATVATVAILREAGILLGEPDAGLTYEIIQVLRDNWLFMRPSGLDIQLTVSEGYLRRADEPGGGDVSGQRGRVEQVLASAGYGQQLQDDKLEIAGHGYGRYRLFAPDDQPSPWAIGASANMRRYTYGEHGDPYGLFDLGGTVQLAQDGVDFNGDGSIDTKAALRVTGTLGFTWWLNQASGIRLGADVKADSKELFVGAQLSATFGLLDVTFANL